MKIFLVLEYDNDNHSKVVDLYASKSAALERVVRLGNGKDVTDTTQPTFHIIQKSVKGLHGIKFQVSGKKRFLEVSK